MWVYEKKVLCTSCTYRKNGDMKEKAHCATIHFGKKAV